MPELSSPVAAQLAGWPVGRAALAVIGPDGVLERCGDDGPFRWASVTKIATALTVLDLVADGLLDLDRAAGPEGATLRHLLAHASGISADSDRAMARPGTRRIYSNRGIEVAAEVAADVTGTPFPDLLADRVLEPLGMVTAVLEGSPAHGMSGTIDDLAALGRELLTPAQTLPGVVAAASTVAFPGLAGVLPGYGRQEHNDWGLGCEIRDHKSPHWTAPENSPETFGHFGQSGSFLWVDPVARLACAGLADEPFGDWAVEVWPPMASLVLRTHGHR